MLKILDHRRAPIGSAKQCWPDQGNYVIREALHNVVGTSLGFGGWYFLGFEGVNK